MDEAARSDAFFEKFGLGDIDRIADPDAALYKAFDLGKAGLKELLSPSVWGRGLSAIFSGNPPGVPRGDTLQMPGVFLIHKGAVVNRFAHRTIADRPDFKALACGDGSCPVG
jgi:hypothetical protein